MPTIITRAPEGLRTWRAASVTVETTPRIWLADEEPVVWTTQPNVYLDRLAIHLNKIDAASLSYHYGRLRQHDASTWTDAEPGALRRYYVRLTIEFHAPEVGDFNNTSTLVWVGYIADTQYSYVQAGVPGVEQLTAYGLEWFLDRNKIYDSVFIKEAPELDGSILQPPETVRIQRPQVFNGGSNGYTTSKSGARGNRDKLLPLFFNRAIPAGDYPKGAGLYPTRDPDSPALWTGADIIAYTLEHHTPLDSDGLYKPVQYATEWDLVVGEQLGGLTPTIRTEGRTPKEIIDAVANPRRGIAWHISGVDFAQVELELGNAVATVSFHTLNPSDIALPSGGTLPANDNQVDIDITSDATLATANVKRKMTRSFNRVRAVGAKMTSTFTLCSQQEINEAGYVQFDRKWTHDEQLRYMAGALFDSDTEAGERFDAKVNDKARTSDAVKNAYTRFGPPDNWNGRIGSDPGFQESVFPNVDGGGGLSGEIDVYVPAMVLCARTRLPAGTGDYSDDFQPPRVYVQPDLDTEGATLAKGWRYADTLNEGDSPLKAYKLSMTDSDGLDFYVESTGDSAASLTLEDVTAAITAAPGGGWIGASAYVSGSYNATVDGTSAIPMTGVVVVNDAGGSPPSFPSTMDISKLNAVDGEVRPGSLHYFKYNGSSWDKFAGWSPNEIKGEIGWDQLCITLTAEADRHCEGVFESANDGYPIEELVIDAGDDYRLDVLASGTVLDISADGSPKRADASQLLRNDEGLLRDIARSSANYYREEPAEFELSWSRLHNLFALGMMVNDIGVDDGESFSTIDTVDAVVASIEWDFTASRTTIKSLGIAADPPQGQIA